MVEFSPHQEAALKAAAAWLKDRRSAASQTPQIFRLFGYAGTGKTTLARHIAASAGGEVAFAAFTGKAASVMRAKGCTDARTIHSLIYRPRDRDEETPSFELWDDSPASKAKLIIVDECSMVDPELGRDLLSFGVPLLVLGDPAQLPPIQGGGFFTEALPDAMLTEVHRQAKDDPIVHLSMAVREGRSLAAGRYGESEVVARSALDPLRVTAADQVLVGRNATRRAYNARMREVRGLKETLPQAGDKLVCLRNNKKKGLFNGGLWTLIERRQRKSGVLALRIKPEDEPWARTMRVTALPDCFLGGLEALAWDQRKRHDEFDYGYVLTVHKAQGSQWDEVCLFDESFAFPEARARWLYTGITRAAKKLTVVV
jgi:ATP-dependent exoDNAse (exonuclease V) alpha subunit